jgi:hypothetical protein
MKIEYQTDGVNAAGWELIEQHKKVLGQHAGAAFFNGAKTMLLSTLAVFLKGYFPGTKAVRHIKRGSTYDVLGEAEMQISVSKVTIHTKEGDFKSRVINEGDKLVVYRCRKTGKLWLRYAEEMNDGRFEEIQE